MNLLSIYKVSQPSIEKVPADKEQEVYKRLRNRTFWGACSAYSLYYVCRLALSVVKQPLIDGGVLSASQLGLIGSAMLFVYAIGKFMNGFVADYCNIRRFMATGLLISSLINLLLGGLGYASDIITIPSFALMLMFAILWGANGWAQSMGSPPAVISLSRWFPLKERGTWYSILSSTPYLGEFLTFNLLGMLVTRLGWESCFIISSVIGMIGSAVIIIFVTDTPESRGLRSIQELSDETVTTEDTEKVSILQKKVLLHPGIWVIALSSSFIYITKYALSGWGVLFLQKAKDFSLESATQIIAWSAASGVLGTIAAGWLSDKVFKGDRAKPALLSGFIGMASLAGFLFLDGSYVMNIVFVSLFSLAVGVLYCIVAGLMALDIVPRKATGAALGIVGISSYVAAGIQDVVSGYLIEGYQSIDGSYNFVPVSVFWLVAAFLAFVLPVVNWRRLKK
ncbi:MAG: MFS transporter [Bacteroidales bacterium]|nr:MFS transporter [Candidatus Cryptobacteroides caccocaballi]